MFQTKTKIDDNKSSLQNEVLEFVSLIQPQREMKISLFTKQVVQYSNLWSAKGLNLPNINENG
jgi:hypothetical protein